MDNKWSQYTALKNLMDRWVILSSEEHQKFMRELAEVLEV